MGCVGLVLAGVVGGVSCVSFFPRQERSRKVDFDADESIRVWGVAALAGRTSVDTEIIIYAVLDLLAKPVFGCWLLVGHRAIAESTINLGGYWSQGLAAEGRIRIGDED